MKQPGRYLIILIISLLFIHCKEKYIISEPDERAPFHEGTVADTMNSGGYTYILMKNEAGKYFWLACLEMKVKKGEKIKAPQGYIMRNFTSKTLQKTFSSILFINSVEIEGSASPIQKDEEMKTSQNNFTERNNSNLKNVKTVNECYKDIGKLNGQMVTVRGKVVKYLPGIMKKNWIHLQDGTGTQGSNDLTVTTIAETKAGETVVITGRLVKDRNFGSGYQYPVIVEDAMIVVE